jgi:hypothetical protein
MDGKLRTSAFVLAAALMAGFPASGSAQWVLAPTVGIDLPVGDLGDLVKSGPIFDVFLGYEVANQVVAGANGTLSLLPGDELSPDRQKLPDVDLWRLMAEVQINALHPSAAWGLWFGGGVGAAVFAPATGSSSTDLSVTLFADVLYKATTSVSVGASLRGFAFFDDGDEFISVPVELKARIAL